MTLEYRPDFATIATKFANWGAYVVPAEPGQKICKLPEWQNKATRDTRQIISWNVENPHYNCAIVGKLELGALWGFDDDGGVLAEYESEHGQIKTYRVRTVSGNTQLLFKATASSIAMGNLTAKNERGEELFSTRADNRYVISAGSVAHPNNDPNQPLAAYTAVDLTAPIEAPERFIEWLKQRAAKMPAQSAARTQESVQVHEGGRNSFLASRLGTIHQAGVKMPELLAVALQLNQECCVPPLEEKEVRTISESIGRYPIKPSGQIDFTQQAAPDRPLESESVNVNETSANSLNYLPGTALASTRLQDIYLEYFQDAGWPLSLALPALVTAASVVVPFQARGTDSLVLGDDVMTNLYTALIAGVHVGKSRVAEWAGRAIGVYDDSLLGSHYFEGKWGSAEQMLKALHKKQSLFTSKSVLICSDEWAHLFSKAAIPDASFPTVLTTSFYRRNQFFTLGGPGGGREYNLSLAMSFIGGIVEEDFDSVFGSHSLGGLYDRFLFGRAPNGFKWNYQPCPIPPGKHFTQWNLKPVQIDGSVYECTKQWSKDNPGLGRIAEICTRIATIYGSLDGRPIITGKDVEPLKDLALYQVGLRQMFRPNPGQNPDAVFANKALAWIQKFAGEWTSIAKLKQHTWRVEQNLGPAVAVRSLIGLSRSGRIDLWLSDGRETPSDYRGPIPRIGLVRRVK